MILYVVLFWQLAQFSKAVCVFVCFANQSLGTFSPLHAACQLTVRAHGLLVIVWMPYIHSKLFRCET